MKSQSPSSDVRTLLHEKLDAMLDECDLVMDSTEIGHILNDLDHFLFIEGRKFAKKSSNKNSKNESNAPKSVPKESGIDCCV